MRRSHGSGKGRRKQKRKDGYRCLAVFITRQSASPDRQGRLVPCGAAKTTMADPLVRLDWQVNPTVGSWTSVAVRATYLPPPSPLFSLPPSLARTPYSPVLHQNARVVFSGEVECLRNARGNFVVCIMAVAQKQKRICTRRVTHVLCGVALLPEAFFSSWREVC